MILTPLQKLPKNGEDWGKIIVTKGFKKLPKVQNIAQSGHIASTTPRPRYSNDKKKYVLNEPASVNLLFIFVFLRQL